jgi:hypothetical protein
VITSAKQLEESLKLIQQLSPRNLARTHAWIQGLIRSQRCHEPVKVKIEATKEGDKDQVVTLQPDLSSAIRVPIPNPYWQRSPSTPEYAVCFDKGNKAGFGWVFLEGHEQNWIPLKELTVPDMERLRGVANYQHLRFLIDERISQLKEPTNNG